MHTGEYSRQYTVGRRVTAIAEKVLSFGVFVRLEDGTRAYVRRRELSLEGDADPRQLVSVSDTLQAVVLSLSEPGKLMELSVRSLLPDPWEQFSEKFRVRDTVVAVIKQLVPHGAFAQIIPGVDGFIPLEELAIWKPKRVEDVLWIGDYVEATIIWIDGGQRKVGLSIRQRMEQLARVEAIATRVIADEQTRAAAMLELKSVDELIAIPQNQEQISPILVVDDSDFVREPLVKWLESLGYQARGAGTAREVLALCQSQEQWPGLIIVDLDMPEVDGLSLIRLLRVRGCEAIIAVMSSPEWVNSHYGEIEEVGAATIFAKPIDPKEIRQFLLQLDVDGASMIQHRSETVIVETKASERLSATMLSGVPLAKRLHEGLQRLLETTRAEQAIVFHCDQASGVISIIAEEGVVPLNIEAIYSLVNSPVGDVIREGEAVWENQASRGPTGKFDKLLRLLPFESCIGVPVEANGKVEHALFLFHRRPDSFSHYRLRDAWAMATLFAVAIERQTLRERLYDLNADLLRGQLSTALSHEIGNRLLGLETGLESICSDLDDLRQQCPELENNPGFTEIKRTLDRAVETGAGLRNLVGNFHRLMQARTKARQTSDVNRTLQQSISMSPVLTLARQARVNLRLNLSKRLPTAIGNDAGLYHIFLNLILNAIQHMDLKPSERRALEISTTCEVVEGRRLVKVRFSDTGPGIHRQLWEKIFTLGFTTKPEGSGLGLYIARSLVESMGGRIFVEKSMVPLGTTFVVVLLAADDDEASYG